jgi:predicted PhzF superfamily epimerase YddE/YHI9
MRHGEQYQLDFPIKAEEKTGPPAGLIEALNVDPLHVGKNQFDYLVEVQSEAIVRSLVPDLKRLAIVKCRGVIVTARSESPTFDFVSRFFAPAVGVDEDPVTGSAHCCLADYWGKRLGKTEMVGYQASARGGIVQIEVRGSRIVLGGEAVIVAQGELLVG